MPRTPLLSMITVTGMSSRTLQASSCSVIMKLPSPAMSTTWRLGQAVFAPMAAGNPNPIVPKPPLLMNVRGFSVLKYSALHIWFCPTSVVSMASSGSSLRRIWSRGLGFNSVGSAVSGGLSCCLVVLTRWSHWFSVFFLACLIKRSYMAAKALLASATIGTSISMFLPISAASMSMWIIFASGQNVFSVPVERSEKRVPTASTTSASKSSLFASGLPCMPILPMLSGWISGKLPLPINVVATGASSSSAMVSSSSAAFAVMTPPPASITGRSASMSISTALRICSGCGLSGGR